MSNHYSEVKSYSFIADQLLILMIMYTAMNISIDTLWYFYTKCKCLDISNGKINILLIYYTYNTYRTCTFLKVTKKLKRIFFRNKIITKDIKIKGTSTIIPKVKIHI